MEERKLLFLKSKYCFVKNTHFDSFLESVIVNLFWPLIQRIPVEVFAVWSLTKK